MKLTSRYVDKQFAERQTGAPRRTLKHRSNVHRLVLLSAVLTLGACAHKPPLTLARGEILSVVSDGSAGRVQPEVDDKIEKAGKGAALGVAGAVGGVAAGGLAGLVFGLSCGPAAVICVPLAAVAGAGTGGVMGGALGVTEGGKGGIPVNKAKQFNALSTLKIQHAGILAQLEGSFVQCASRSWQIEAQSTHQVTIRLLSLEFDQPGSERLRIRVKAEMDIANADRSETVKIERTTRAAHIDQWLDDDAFLSAQINQALSSTANAMVDALALGV